MVAAAGEPLNCQRANPEVTVKLPSADVVPRLRGRQRVVVHVDSRTARCVGALALVCAACWLIALLAGDYRHAQWAVAGRLGWSLTVLAAVAFIARGIFLGRPVTAMHATAAGLFLLAGLAAHVLVADLLGEILIAGSGWALMWPTSAHPRPEDLPRVWALINATRADSLAPFAMQAGKSHHFSAAGTAALAYRTRIGYAVVSGDPIKRRGAIPPAGRRLRGHVSHARLANRGRGLQRTTARPVERPHGGRTIVAAHTDWPGCRHRRV